MTRGELLEPNTVAYGNGWRVFTHAAAEGRRLIRALSHVPTRHARLIELSLGLLALVVAAATAGIGIVVVVDLLHVSAWAS